MGAVDLCCVDAPASAAQDPVDPLAVAVSGKIVECPFIQGGMGIGDTVRVQ